MRIAPVIVPMVALSVFGCRSAPPEVTSVPMRVEVLGFADCPNTAEFRRRVELAAEAAGDLLVVYVDQESLPSTDLRRGYPAPTALLAGRDLFGLPVPADTSMGCRLYAGGLPSVEEIVRRIESLRSP